jgi:hypothetical protein
MGFKSAFKGLSSPTTPMMQHQILVTHNLRSKKQLLLPHSEQNLYTITTKAFCHQYSSILTSSLICEVDTPFRKAGHTF